MEALVNFLTGTDTSLTGSVGQLMQTLTDIVEKTILPIIYVVLGLFLIVKGALLGMQIVKAADEPQVRQEKISSLKWLVIGVAIAYAVTIVADVLVGFFKDTKLS